MSGFNQGPQGGGGVRPGGGMRPPIGGTRPLGGGGGGGPRRDDRELRVADLWPDYLAGGYFDDDGNPRLAYVSRRVAGDDRVGVEPLVRAMADGSPKLTTGQVRRFFQHCRGVEARLKSGRATWPQVRPAFEFLDAAAADAYGKQPRKIPDLFYDFVRRNVAAVRTEADFRRGFLPHFEALVGFGSLHLKERNN